MKSCWPLIRRKVLMLAMLLGIVSGTSAQAQSYLLPAPGDFGAVGPFSVSVNTFTNPIYPTASGGDTLVVSVYHPGGALNPALPTIFFAHGYTSPIGHANDYLNILNNLASWGYNVVFSPYEGGASPNIPLRFDELATGFEAAVTNYSLNTARVGFAGHSYGGGFLPSMILHEMMGKADFYRPGHFWGGTAAFFYAMAPGFVYSGGGQTGVTVPQTITFPTNLNVIEQVFADDMTIADPRVAIDVFYNITTPNSQKDFIIVHGESHGTNTVVANHFLPNAFTNADVPLQAWAILRRLDALASWTFGGDTNARSIALGNGITAQTYEGVWSDQIPALPLEVTDLPNPSEFPSSYVVVNWDSAANPRPYALFSGPPVISSLSVSGGRALVTVSNLLANHNYIEQQTTELSSPNWSNAISFTVSSAESPGNSTTLTNTLGEAGAQFWRILMP